MHLVLVVHTFWGAAAFATAAIATAAAAVAAVTTHDNLFANHHQVTCTSSGQSNLGVYQPPFRGWFNETDICGSHWSDCWTIASK